MDYYGDGGSDSEYGDCDLCSKGDELSTCEACSNRYCLDCFGGECCTGKSLCVRCVYVCKTCNDNYNLKWKGLADAHNIDAAFCEGCTYRCSSCIDGSGEPLYFCKEHAAEHNGACPGVTPAAAQAAAAAHAEEVASTALASAQKRLAAAKAELLAATKEEADARVAHAAASAALPAAGAGASSAARAGSKRPAASEPELATRPLVPRAAGHRK